MIGPGPIASSNMDEDAIKFIIAATITSSIQMYAIDRLVKRFKDSGLWNKFNAIYPFVGGTATTHKYNLKDPRDLDAAYRLTISAGWTHTSNGMIGTGAVFGCPSCSTSLSPNSVLSSTDYHLSLYSRTNNQTSGYDIASNEKIGIIMKYSNGTGYILNNTYNSFSNSNRTDKLHVLSNKSSTATLYRNATSIHSIGASSFTLPTEAIAIGSDIRPSTGFVDGSSKEFAFVSIGSGLTSGEVSTLNIVVQEYQTTLGRQV